MVPSTKKVISQKITIYCTVITEMMYMKMLFHKHCIIYVILSHSVCFYLCGRLSCTADLWTFLLGKESSEKVPQTAYSKTLQHGKGMTGSRLEKKDQVFSLKHFVLCKNPDIIQLSFHAGSIISWKSSQRSFFFWNSEVSF